MTHPETLAVPGRSVLMQWIGCGSVRDMSELENQATPSSSGEVQTQPASDPGGGPNLTWENPCAAARSPLGDLSPWLHLARP